MRAIIGDADRGPIFSGALVLGSLTVLTLTVAAGTSVVEVSLGVCAVAACVLWYRSLLQWHVLLSLLALVILFVPIRRYTMPGALPFELEPYRLLVAFVLLGWLASLLADPRVRLRGSVLDRPLFLLVVAALASVLVNPGRIAALEVSGQVGKKLTFLASFVLLFYLIVSVLRTRETITLLLRVLVAGAAVVAVFAVWESRTEQNPFNELHRWVPFLEPHLVPEDAPGRGARLRAYASAQHPIALGAAFAMLIPPALYLARSTRRAGWWCAAALLVLGAVSTVSRTSIVMLLVCALVFLWLRPREVRRLWPLVVPALVVVQLALPGNLGTLKAAFFPAGGLIAEQREAAGTRGSGRVADLAPTLAVYRDTPLLGQGYGTRVVTGLEANAPILDNQWLASLVETGALGVLALLYLFGRFLRRVAAEARHDDSDRGWMLTAVAASVAAYAVGMFTYDSFSFIQVTFLLFILLGLGAALLRTPRETG